MIKNLWKTRGDDDMTDEDTSPAPHIPVATMPPPPPRFVEVPAADYGSGGDGAFSGGVEAPRQTATFRLPMSDQLRQVADLAEQHEADKLHWHQLSEAATDRIKDLARENEYLKLEIAQKANDMQNLQTQIYEMQQDFKTKIYEMQQDLANHRAIQASNRELAVHLVSQFDRLDLPPIKRSVRQKKSNGKTTVQDVVDSAAPEAVLDQIATTESPS